MKVFYNGDEVNIKDYKEIMGIYSITNLVNGKRYIGSTNNIQLRFRSHKYTLNGNCHMNFHLQRSYNKYGKNNFIFEILEIVIICDNLLNIEQDYIDKYNSIDYKYGYNILSVFNDCINYNIDKNIRTIPRAHSKLTEEDVINIRTRLLNGEYYDDILIDYPNITKYTLIKIKEFKLWKNICSDIVIENKNKKGSRHYFSKLSEEQVLNIKQMILDGYNNKYIGDLYGVGKSCIASIRKGKTWRHLFLNDEFEQLVKNPINRVRKLFDEDIEDIKLMIKNKFTYKEIAKKYNIPFSNYICVLRKRYEF